MRISPTRTGLALLLAVFASAAAERHGSELKKLYDAHQWFKLRDAVEAGDAPAFYRGAVSCAFHDWRAAERYLRSAVAAPGGPEESQEARGLRIAVYQLTGEYGKALSEIRALQKAGPDEKGLDNGAALFGVLSRYPPQRVVKRHPATVRGTFDDGNLFIPVSVNGKPANYIVDTGANFSVVSEAEAGRLGLSVRDVPDLFGNDASGAHVQMRVAMADHVAVGDFQLEHAVFLVVANDNMPFVELPPDSQGVLGLPVLLDMERIRWNSEEWFRLRLSARRRALRASHRLRATPAGVASVRRSNPSIFSICNNNGHLEVSIVIDAVAMSRN